VTQPTCKNYIEEGQDNCMPRELATWLLWWDENNVMVASAVPIKTNSFLDWLRILAQKPQIYLHATVILLRLLNYCILFTMQWKII